MNKVIVSCDCIELERFLSNDRTRYSYIIVTLDCISMESFLKEKEYDKVDIREGLGLLDFAKEYIDFIGRLNKDYNSIYWWANSISHKGTFVSDLHLEVYYYYCLVSLIERRNGNYIILSRDFVLNNSVKKYCEENGIECRISGANKKKSVVTHLRRCFLSSVNFLFDGWMRKIWVRVYLGKGIKKAIRKNSPSYILRSWIQSRSFVNDKYVDLFFGRLPEFLKQKGVEPVILAGILNDYKKLISKINRVKDFLIIPQEYFVGYLDYVKVIMRNIANRPKIKKAILFHQLDVADLVIACLEKDYEYGEVNKNLIYFYYIKGLLKRARPYNFLFTFEGQAWERMSILALRRYSPFTKIIGYAHSSITKNWLGYFYSKEEKDIAILPDRIVTVGEEPRIILDSNGNYGNNTKIRDGCALRYEHLFKKDKLKRNGRKDILAAFSINQQYSLKLFEFLYEALGGRQEYKVILRPHPFAPLEAMIKSWGMSLCNNFTISKTLQIEEDLQKVSMVIYIDTTLSIEALMCGMPIIHLDFKEPASPDPLFKLNSLKWTVSNKDELFKAINDVYAMNHEEYLEKYNKAISYLKRYFYPVEEKYLQEFIA